MSALDEHGPGHDRSCVCWQRRPGCACYLWDQDCPKYKPITDDERPVSRHEHRVRGRQSGKTSEMATEVAKRCGLQYATVMDLLRSGWTYTETLGEVSRWTR